YDLLLVDDDGAAPTVAFDAPASSAPEEGGSVAHTVRASDYAPFTIIVPVTTSGTATDGVDFNLTTSTLTIPVGELTADVGLDVLDDMDVEGDETVSLDLGAPTGATLGSPANHLVTIVDDENADPVVDFTAATSTATEADGTVFISVALDVPAPADVTLPVLVMGTATGGGVDYTLQTSPLVIPTGSSTGAFQIDLAQDPLFEITETVVLDLDVPTGATLGTVTTHTLDLTDDDPMPTVQFTSFRFVVEEDVGTYDVDLVLSEAAGVDVSVPYTITGRASGPGDISFPAGPAVVTAGSTTGAIPITVVLDTEFEPGEVFLVALGAPDNALPGAIDSHLVLIAEVEDALSGALSDPLVPSAPTVDFPQTRVGDVSAPQTVQFANVSPRSVTVTAVAPTGPAAADFVADVVGGLPAVIGPGQNLTVDFTFEPQTYGQRSSTVGAELTFSGASPVPVALQGLSLGAPGDDLRVTCGSAGFIAPDRRFWAGDFGFAGGTVNVFAGAEVAGTDLDELYRTSRFGPAFDYAFDLPNGRYEVVVRGWEPTKTSPGERVLDVSLEGVLALDDLDYYAEVGPEAAYVSPPLMVDVTDGTLDVEVRSVVAQALVSAIDVRAVPVLSSSTSALDFGLVDQGVVETMDFVVDNGGLAPAQIDRVTFELGPIGESSDFSVTDTAATYAGATTTVSFTTDFPLLPGTNVIPITYAPSYHEDHQFTLRLESTATGDAFAVAISGTGAADASWGFLHPIPDNDPTFIVDYDSNGTEEVRLLGGESHTHEPGQTLLDFEWSINGTPVASTVDTAQPFAVGVSTVELEIGDTNVPQSRASDSRLIVVHPVAAVPGALLEYFDGSVVDEVTLLDAVPAAADFVERLDGLRVDPAGGVIGTSPFDGDVMVRMSGSFTLAAQRTLEFVATGGVGQRVLIDGGLVSGPLVLAAGAHTVEARFAVSTLTDVPAFVTVLEGGSPAFDVQGGITHDESGVAPVIHTMPTVGTDLGGNRITIEGFGFFPKDLVTVNWGTQVFTSAEFDDWTGETIVLTTPPGSGTVSVSVDTPNGTSNSVDYAYSPTGPVPVRFDLLLSKEVTISNVTSGAWGPDGKLYVSVVDGTIRIISFDDDWDVTGIDFRLGVSGLTNSDTMGVAFNPYDTYDPGDPTSIKLYVSHGEQFQNGGGPFTGPSFFTGQVTRLSGPNFDTPDPVVTQLPVSNLDHCVNGILFDDNGDLMICVGGNTNAGVKAPLLGDLPESPLSGGILRARTSSPSFNGVCLYLDSSSGVLVDDQVFGEQLDLSPGVDLEVFASGFRNSWDLMLHTNGYFYATENGPNLGYGPASLTLTTDSGSLATKPDEFNLVEKGNYYGSANRARGRYDLRQATYRSGFDPSEPEAYSAPLTLLDSSTDGLTEYRGTAFNSGLRGDVVAMKWNSGLYVIELTERGRRVGTKTLYQNTQNTTFPPNRGLDVVYGPGGALIAIDYTGGKIRVQVPDDVAAVGPTPYDITPWRVPAGGGQPFVIGGVNFGNDLGAVSVSIGGIAATVTSVSDTRIRGEIPPSPNGVPTDMLDVEVTVGAMTMTLEDALRYLPAAPGQALGTWFDDSVLPLQLGEVSSCVIDGMLYVVGQGDARTFRRDLVNHSWNFALAQRPLPGNHHGLEVVDGKIYLIGGLDNGAAGQVQIYDPALDQWSLGAQMPWDGGSCATALIDGLIYVGGGNLQAGGTAGNFAVYDPALDSWTPLGAMPT
ncbi:MAG: Calx-beta domain-containing protein, partial [Planctomycetota bacterium]